MTLRAIYLGALVAMIPAARSLAQVQGPNMNNGSVVLQNGGTLIFRAVPGRSALAPAKPSPPVVHEATLENPRTGQAKSFLDLDSGKTFAYGDSSPEDY